MKYFGTGLSELHKELNSIIRKKECFKESKELFLQLHSKLHPGIVSNTPKNEVDALLSDLSDNEYSVMPTKDDETIAWVLWHIARIEDLTMNKLVAKSEQVFNKDWQIKLNSPITDTANALSDEQIMELSKKLDKNQLLYYRNEVGKRTRQIVSDLKADDIVRKIDKEDTDNILACGGVTTEADSVWLLDFWGKKDVAGILLMPPTRHEILHLNDCCKWKQQIKTKTRFYCR